jgi:hypothetical protein
VRLLLLLLLLGARRLLLGSHSGHGASSSAGVLIKQLPG